MLIVLVYNMGPDLGAFLAAYAIVIDGDLLDGTWSIGGPQQSDPLLGGILRTGQGLSYSHNSYEGDGSIARYDAYTNNGDAHSLSLEKFEKVYAVGGNDTSENGFDQRYTIDKFRSRYSTVQDEAIANNPYYFTGAFSTIVVVPAAYNFVINFMSNFSKEEPTGYLVSLLPPTNIPRPCLTSIRMVITSKHSLVSLDPLAHSSGTKDRSASLTTGTVAHLLLPTGLMMWLPTLVLATLLTQRA